MGLRYMIVPEGVEPPVPGREVARTGGYVLLEPYGWEPRASAVPAWSVAGSTADAFQRISRPGFDAARTAVLERDPGGTQVKGAVPGEASYTETDPEHVTVQVNATAPSIVVVRNSYDERWSATVDGRAADVLPVDGFLQGVPVSAGRHQVELTYRDPAIGRGLAVSALVWSLLLAALLACLMAERRRGPHRRVRAEP